jgi:hypothetical protein
MLAAGALLATAAEAQIRPPARDTVTRTRSDTIPRQRRDTARVPGDTLREEQEPEERAGRDTTPAPIRWVEEDSVTRALLSRPGYTVTRYQGPILTFDALTHAIDIFIGAGDTSRVAVQREDRLLVADTSISYNEATGIARATGRVVIREGTTDLTGLGGEYDLRERSVTILGGRTSVQTEENWIVAASKLKIAQVDSGPGQNFFGQHGNLTSCNDTTHAGLPHYHFAFKEIKRTAGNTLVARPAVLYISDIPVMWLPFVFQDMRPGRRSGLLTPRIGVTDFIRNSPTYRRNVDNIGWYWAINDYMDAEASFDWLSGTGQREGEAPGFTRYNGKWSYRWIDRFLSGSIRGSHSRQATGTKDFSLSWNHSQEFTRRRSMQADVNWVQNTTVQRETYVNPYAVLATIRSSVKLQDQFGPARVALGADRTQYPGRDEVSQTFPSLSITTGTLELAPWFNWTPSFQLTEQRKTDITQPSQLGALFREQNGVIDTVLARQNQRTTRASFDTPIQVFGFTLSNGVTFSEEEVEFPQVIAVVNPDSTQPPQDRIFARTYRSTLDWNPSFSLPALAQQSWKITPSVGFANVAPGPFMVRSHLSGGEWIRQTKRPTFGLSVSPTLYGFIPGFAGFSRFRHTIAPRVSYQYAPKAGVNEEFLLAQNYDPRRYIGAISQNEFSLGLNTNIEGKGRPAAGDTTATAESAAKVKVLTLNFSSLAYDVSRYQKTRDVMRGLTTSNFSTSISSDLLPDVRLSLQHSLFQGDNINSDTAVFSPFLTGVSGQFTLNARRNPFMLLTRLFGRAVPATEIASAEIVEPLDDAEARAASVLPVAGSPARQAQMVVPPSEGWEAAFTFSSSRQRPPKGGNIVDFDPGIRCEPFRGLNPIAYENCLIEARTNPTTEAPVTSPVAGGAFYRVPATTSIGSNLRFALTPKWSGSWNTSYDLERNEFASHVVQLQRDLHDWRAIFSFTQSPSGSSAFSFFIALKAEPDLKFDYNRSTYRQQVNTR